MCRAKRRQIERVWSFAILVAWLTVASAAFASHGTLFAHEIVSRPLDPIPASFHVFPAAIGKNEKPH